MALWTMERANNVVLNLVAEIHKTTRFFDAPEFLIARMIVSLLIHTRRYSTCQSPRVF